MDWTGGLDWWTGLVDWTSGLDWWTGLVDWTGGLDLWTGLVDWTHPDCHKNAFFRCRAEAYFTKVAPLACSHEAVEVKGNMHI